MSICVGRLQDLGKLTVKALKSVMTTCYTYAEMNMKPFCSLIMCVREKSRNQPKERYEFVEAVYSLRLMVIWPLSRRRFPMFVTKGLRQSSTAFVCWCRRIVFHREVYQTWLDRLYLGRRSQPQSCTSSCTCRVVACTWSRGRLGPRVEGRVRLGYMLHTEIPRFHLESANGLSAPEKEALLEKLKTSGFRQGTPGRDYIYYSVETWSCTICVINNSTRLVPELRRTTAHVKDMKTACWFHLAIGVVYMVYKILNLSHLSNNIACTSISTVLVFIVLQIPVYM